MGKTIVAIGQRAFELFALALPRGPNFEPFVFAAAWMAEDAGAIGAVLVRPEDPSYRVLILRRRTDHRLVVTHDQLDLRTRDDAETSLRVALRPEEPAEPIPPGEKRRPRLMDLAGRDACDTFKMLASDTAHLPALVTVGEAYLALPHPDDNFVSDFQTQNFDSRLWELYLLAAFREQGAHVSQRQASPDFFLEREGHRCYVEAVTANAAGGRRLEGFPPPVHAPSDRGERLVGAPAVRFAKTIRSKLQRAYDAMPHVQGEPFALAVADFHAPSSMVWSREALPCYLYGVLPEVIETPGGRVARQTQVDTLRGASNIPAGLFRDPSVANLSAVIFSNAGTLSKFNRMGLLAGYRPQGVRMIRSGLILDRTPGALEAIPFELDVLSERYAAMWPGGEAWCQELEVFHNPSAAHPMSRDLLPGATHWFEANGEVCCSTMWETSVLSSITTIIRHEDGYE